jgi:hypothetical protein
MKIKNLVLSLSLAGLCLNQASAQLPYNPNAAAKRSIGDSSPVSTRPAAFANSRGLSDMNVDNAAAMEHSSLAPTVSESYVVSTGHSGHSSASQDYGLSSNFGGCGSSTGWFSAESLLWFSKGISSPALVNTSDFGVLPVTGAGGVQSMFGGGDGIDLGLLPGFRVSGGAYLDSEQKLGLGGRAYGLFGASTSYSLSSDGSGGAANPSIGIPFYNLAFNQEDAFLVAYQDNLGPDKTGVVSARSDLDMYGADGSLYMLLTRSEGMRMDLLGGYTFNTLRNSVGLESVSSSFRFPNVGQITTTNDLFSTENIFHGGHLGVLSSVAKDRITFSTLAKIAFGNMRQTSTVRGYSIVEDALGNQTTLGAGILTQPSNIGVQSRDTFGFIPELGIKLGLAASENVQFTVGYTVMMWSGVAMAGDQIDNVVDPTQLVLPNAGTRPNATLNEHAFWMQGIDLGLNFAF